MVWPGDVGETFELDAVSYAYTAPLFYAKLDVLKVALYQPSMHSKRSAACRNSDFPILKRFNTVPHVPLTAYHLIY